MATQTANLGLTKPGYDEAADVVPAVNNNMDTLDAKIGAVPANTSVEEQITSNSQAIGNLSNLTTTEKGSLVGAANELNSKITNKIAKSTGHPVTAITIGANDWSDVETDIAIPDGYIAHICIYSYNLGLVAVNEWTTNGHLCVSVRNVTNNSITLQTNAILQFVVFK